jgi:hypothetical protein
MSDKTLHIKPAKAGAVVRFPDDPARTLAAKGERVKPSTYWTRRLLDGSVIDADADKKNDATKTREARK